MDQGIDIEQTLAGVILHKPEVVADLTGIATEADFKDIRARKVFSLAKECFRNQEALDLVLAASKMPEHATWLSQAYDVIPINHKFYAIQIRNAARLRRLKTGMQSLASRKFDQAEDMLFEIEQLYRAESNTGNRKSGNIKAVMDRFTDMVERNRRAGRLHGIPTGFDFLEKKYVRFVPGHMWIITGWTSTGKTQLLIEFIGRLPKNVRALIISTEMTEEQLIARMISRETGHHNQAILSGSLEESKLAKVYAARDQITERNLALCDDIIEIEELESLVIRESMRRDLNIVFIDYVQQLQAKGVPYKEQGREIAGRIQQLAKRASTCIVCFSQVSNEVGRGNVDQLEAKGAGEWAACADVGIRLMRDKKDNYRLIFNMQKGRHLGTFQHELQFMANFTRIEEVLDNNNPKSL